MEQILIVFRYKIVLIFVCILGIIPFLLTCNSNKKIEMDPELLCLDFYELNKNNTFEGLYNVQILGIREFSEYDEKTQKYIRLTRIIGINDTISGKSIILPVFIQGADIDEKRIMFNRCDSSSLKYLKNKYKIISNDSIFESYIKEVESIYLDYNQVKVPSILPYTNIQVNGLRNYIKFTLYRNEEMRIQYRCYYVKDTLFSNDRLKAYFKTLPKFDEHWYYDVNW